MYLVLVNVRAFFSEIVVYCCRLLKKRRVIYYKKKHPDHGQQLFLYHCWILDVESTANSFLHDFDLK